MKTKYTVALSMIAGAAIGAVAIQGLHAQIRPTKVYLVSDSEILDKSAADAYNTQVREALKKAGGNLVLSEKIEAVIGTAPQRVGVTEFESWDKAQAWFKSPERKALASQRDKAVKFNHLVLMEGR